MFRFGETKVAKEKFYAVKKTINIWDVNVDNIVISKLVERKTNSKYLIEYLGKVIRPLDHFGIVRVKTFKTKDKDNRLVSFHTNDEKLLEKYKAI